MNLIIDFSGFGHDLQEGTLKKRSFKHRFYDLRHCITYTNSCTKNTNLELRWLINSTHSYSLAVLSLSHTDTHKWVLFRAVVLILAFVCVGLSSYTTNEHLKRLFSRFGVVTEGMLCVQVTDFYVFSFCVWGILFGWFLLSEIVLTFFCS